MYVRWTTPNHVEGVTPGINDFKAAVTLSPISVGDAEETVTYAFPIECVPAGPPPPQRIVPVTIFIPVGPVTA